MLSKVDRISWLVFLLKSSENVWFSDDFKGNSNQFAEIRVILKAKFSDDP